MSLHCTIVRKPVCPCSASSKTLVCTPGMWSSATCCSRENAVAAPCARQVHSTALYPPTCSNAEPVTTQATRAGRGPLPPQRALSGTRAAAGRGTRPSRCTRRIPRKHAVRRKSTGACAPPRAALCACGAVGARGHCHLACAGRRRVWAVGCDGT